jgi:hypothetical protein
LQFKEALAEASKITSHDPYDPSEYAKYHLSRVETSAPAPTTVSTQYATIPVVKTGKVEEKEDLHQNFVQINKNTYSDMAALMRPHNATSSDTLDTRDMASDVMQKLHLQDGLLLKFSTLKPDIVQHTVDVKEETEHRRYLIADPQRQRYLLDGRDFETMLADNV